MLRRVLESGVDLVRVNLSHGTLDSHQERIEATRACAVALGKTIGIIIDLQGPKIRIARFKKGFTHLQADAKFIIDANLEVDAGTEQSVGIDYKNLPKEVYPGDILLLDDGLIMLSVEKVEDQKIHCVVKLGGKLSNNKGINRRGGGLSAEPLTHKDREDIQFAAKMNVDYVAVSFPRSANDIHQARLLLEQAGSHAGILAKIERVEAVQDLDNIIESADGVMVARGDLGVEIGYAELPAIQKKIIARARALNRAVITATQMMESMVHNPIPTRAEVSDIANAILDGTDAVMLSAETATGNFPDKAVEAMVEVCLAAERQRIMQVSQHRLDSRFTRVNETIAMAAMYAANHIDTRAIIALTETGSTPLWMSRIRSGIPIYGLSRHREARGRMTLYRGVYPINFDVTRALKDQVTKEALAELLRLDAIAVGDRVVVTKGDIMGNNGGASTLQIMTVLGDK
jgi:pyruvate kinase